MAGSFLDAELDLLIRDYLVSNARVAEDLFGQSRPISTFSARIDLAYLLGLIDIITHRDLHLIRKIRNDFGHNHLPLTFEDKTISSRCLALKLHFRRVNLAPRKIFMSCAVGILAIMHSALKNRERITERANPDFEKVRSSIEKHSDSY